MSEMNGDHFPGEEGGKEKRSGKSSLLIGVVLTLVVLTGLGLLVSFFADKGIFADKPTRERIENVQVPKAKQLSRDSLKQ